MARDANERLQRSGAFQFSPAKGRRQQLRRTGRCRAVLEWKLQGNDIASPRGEEPPPEFPRSAKRPNAARWPTVLAVIHFAPAPAHAIDDKVNRLTRAKAHDAFAHLVVVVHMLRPDHE